MDFIWNGCKKLDDTRWLDIEENVQFSLANSWLNSPSKDCFFISDRENFVYNNRWNLNYVLSYYGSVFGTDIIYNSEIIHLNLPEIQKFKNSKILVIGGGPTTLSASWDPNDYDFIFSCNHFFLSDKLKNLDIALATFTTETDFSETNKDFHDYMQNNSTIICFEDRMQPEEREHFKLIKNLYPDRSMYAHTRYRGKIGAVPRLVCMAVLFGCSELHVVGLDGMKKDEKTSDNLGHAFQKDKPRIGTTDYNLYRRHYVAFWDYLLNHIGRDVKFQNLGEGHPFNMTTDISRQLFPLEKK